MSAPVFARGVLTDWLIDTLESMAATRYGGALLIGDGIAPVDGGWTGGQPGEGRFRAYTVVATGNTARGQRDAVGDIDGSWVANYSLRSVGGNRQQVEWAGDRSRLLLSTMRPVTLDLEGKWRLQQARYSTLGGVSRNDSTDPPYWESTDSVELWLERERT